MQHLKSLITIGFAGITVSYSYLDHNAQNRGPVLLDLQGLIQKCLPYI